MTTKTYWLKTTCMISQFFVGEDPGHGLAGSFGSESIPRLRSTCQPGLWSHFKAQLGKDLLPSSLIGCWQDPVPQGLLD